MPLQNVLVRVQFSKSTVFKLNLTAKNVPSLREQEAYPSHFSLLSDGSAYCERCLNVIYKCRIFCKKCTRH